MTAKEELGHRAHFHVENVHGGKVCSCSRELTTVTHLRHGSGAVYPTRRSRPSECAPARVHTASRP